MSNDPMAEIRASFFVECEDLLESLQDALAAMEGGTDDGETVHIVFRAVHSIKGGAGAFGLNDLVAFAHRLETVLDELRAGGIAADGETVRLLFQAADVLQDQVHAARDDTPPPEGSEATLLALEALTGSIPSEEEPAALDFQPMGLSFDFGSFDGETDSGSEVAQTSGTSAIGNEDGGEATTLPTAEAPSAETGQSAWRLHLTPRPGLYTSGNEVAHLLRSLSLMGEAFVTCQVPHDLELAESCAEIPRLSWIVGLVGDITRAELDEVFDFVTDVCDIEIAATTPGALRSLRPARNASSPSAADNTNATAQTPVTAPALKLVQFPDATLAVPAEKPSAEFNPATVRVDLEKIDRLVNLVGELVINQAMLSQSVTTAGLASPEVTAGLEAFMTLTRDIQDGVMSVRAQPVKPLFQRMARIVREASSMVGKQVRLKIEGEGTEVDKTMIERLADPLTHMIRNAVDHGLEPPEIRLAAGKPREGQITLAAYHRAGRIMIEVSDDGAGINRPKVQSIAAEKGLIPEGALLGDAEVDNLLFLPGFSTADKVSALSGRGVGMDVVKSAIMALGGRISITSEWGRGTTLSISLPLTLAVLDGMVVKAAGQTFVIPLSAIVETAKLSADAIKRVGGQSELLHMRGNLFPLVDLASRLGFRAPGDVNRNGIVLLTGLDDGGYAALIVDDVMEQRQVVIKGLGALFGPMPGVAGATILGDGQIALILDPADLTPKPRSQRADIALAG
ncbi:chemotaxis protein CheA [Paracoccus suum]|uniref:Chemotaxis protein CheA n=1 Tax=Paracoccus suum TaxID=2259340 RepID=A0A344PMV0_9RHOB|nr:chemotaxis protein CheA [Paracoccus suum]AXC50705.1 chemotaxis protein CheA [Paracoccus suum]